MIHADAHGRGVPEIPIGILYRAAMPRALHKAARLGGKGVALLQRERPERRIGHIDAIAVGVELGGRGGILQIVLAVMLCHKGALDVGLANRTKHFDELFPIEAAARGQCLRQLQLPGGRVDKGLQCLIHRACLLGRDISVLAAALIAQRIRLLKNQLAALPDGQHGVRVHLDSIDGVGVAAAPVQIDATVIVTEEVWVPEIKRRTDLLKRIRQRVLCAQDRAVLAAARGAEVQVLSHLAHIRRIIIYQQIAVGVVFPVGQIAAVPESARHRREQIVDTLKVNQCRVSSLTVGNPLSVFHHMLVAVAKVKRVAIASFHFHRTLLSAVGWRTFLSAQEKYVKMNPLRL